MNNIEEAKTQVADMTVELEKMTKVVATKQAECEKLLIKIVSQKREADEKKNKVSFFWISGIRFFFLFEVRNGEKENRKRRK